jgi:DHA2 family multidrug resistance protein
LSSPIADHQAPAWIANRWLVTFTVTIGAIATILATTIINVAVPSVMGAFGVGQDTAQWMASGFLAATTTAMLMSDWFVRQLGRRATYQLAMAVFVFGSFCGVYADSIETVVAARIIQGVAAGVIQPLTMVTIFEAFPPNERGKAMGVFGIGSVMAPSLGPYAGGIAIDAFDWHAVFLLPVPFCIISGILGSFILAPRGPEDKPTKFDWLGFLLLVSFTFSLMTALSHGIRDGWTSDFILCMFALAGVSLAAFLVWEGVCPSPLLNLRLFTIPAYSIVAAISVLMGASVFTTVYTTPLFVQLVQGYTPTLSGMLQIPSGLMMALGSVVFGRLGDFGYHRSLVFMGFVLVASASFLFAGADTNTPFLTLAMWLVINRVGVSSIFPNLNVTGLRVLPRDLLVQGSGAVNFIRQLGGAFGVNVVAVMIEGRTMFHSASLAATQTESNATTVDLVERLRGVLEQGGLAGADDGVINPMALNFLSESVYAQAQMFAFRDTFLLIAVIAVGALIPVLFLKGGRESTALTDATIPPAASPAARQI